MNIPKIELLPQMPENIVKEMENDKRFDSLIYYHKLNEVISALNSLTQGEEKKVKIECIACGDLKNCIHRPPTKDREEKKGEVCQFGHSYQAGKPCLKCIQMVQVSQPIFESEEKANFMQVLPGGHCFTCHKDYEEYTERHPCLDKSNPTNCKEECYKNSKYMSKPPTKDRLDASMKAIDAVHIPQTPANISEVLEAFDREFPLWELEAMATLFISRNFKSFLRSSITELLEQGKMGKVPIRNNDGNLTGFEQATVVEDKGYNSAIEEVNKKLEGMQE